jgi:hypothetical protein
MQAQHPVVILTKTHVIFKAGGYYYTEAVGTEEAYAERSNLFQQYLSQQTAVISLSLNRRKHHQVHVLFFKFFNHFIDKPG